MIARRIFSFLLMFVVITGMTGFDTAYARSASGPVDTVFASTTQVVTWADLGYTTDDTVQGILSQRHYTVNWPESWLPVAGNTVTVKFSHSDALERYSSMAVDWNGTRLGSVLLEAGNIESSQLTLEIPEDQIQAGYNDLSLEFYMGIHEDICEDPDNPAIWATVHSASFFKFAYDIQPPLVDLGMYPLPVLETGSLAKNHLTFVLPDTPSVAELNSLALVSAKLGELTSWDMTSEVITASQAAGQSLQGDVMWIAQSDRLQPLTAGSFPFYNSGQGAFMDLQGQPLPETSGIIWEEISPDDPLAARFLVTGKSDDALLAAARSLASEVTYRRMRGQLGVVESVPEALPETGLDASRQFTLEDLNYTDQTSRGTRIQTVNFVIPLPSAWRVLTEAVVDLHFAHSELLHPERSSLTLSVNGTPVGSTLLTVENSKDGHASFRIPARMLKLGKNRLSVSTNMELLDGYVVENRCTDEYTAEAWVVVYADSQITLPGGATQVSLDLINYPFGFIGSSNLSDMAFIVPDQADISITRAVEMVSFRLGQYSEGLTISPLVTDASHQEEISSRAPHQILVGLPTENAAINRLNDQLPLPFQSGSNLPQPSDKVARVLNAPASVGYVEAALTDSGDSRLVVTGSNAEGMQWAASAVSDPTLIRDLKGDLAILDAPESITVHSIRQPVKVVAETAVPAAQKGINKTTPTWVIWVAGAVLLISLLVLMIFVGVEISKRRKAR